MMSYTIKGVLMNNHYDCKVFPTSSLVKCPYSKFSSPKIMNLLEYFVTKTNELVFTCYKARLQQPLQLIRFVLTWSFLASLSTMMLQWPGTLLIFHLINLPIIITNSIIETISLNWTLFKMRSHLWGHNFSKFPLSSIFRSLTLRRNLQDKIDNSTLHRRTRLKPHKSYKSIALLGFTEKRQRRRIIALA
jgi:hypothetical protein